MKTQTGAGVYREGTQAWVLLWDEHKVDVEEALVCMKTHVFSPGRACEREKQN